MSSPSKIAKILVQAVSKTGDIEETKVMCETFWKETPFIGIGFDSRFVKPFVEGKFFGGELYVDSDKKCYEALQYHRLSIFELMKKLLTKKWMDAASLGKKRNLGGDIKGDGFQNGGALVIDKNGKQLYEYRQEEAAEHISAEDILRALKIDAKPLPNPLPNLEETK